MATSQNEISPKAIVRHTLRAVDSVAGVCGFILNTITMAMALNGAFNGRAVKHLTGGAYIPIVLSVAWNHLEPRTLQQLPNEHKWATMVVDIGIFLGYLAVLIAGGIITEDLPWSPVSRIMLLTFNEMPWIVCA